MKKFWTDKRLGITAVVVIALAVLLSSYINLTGFAVQSGNTAEATAQVKVWADSQINLSVQQNAIKTTVLLDNGTPAENQNVDLYLNDYQSPNFKNKTLFNLSGMSSGTYNLRVIYQGSPNQYINPTSLETQIEISQQGISIGNAPNQTVQTTTQNTTQNETLSLSGCQEFTQQVLWSSGYSNNYSSIDYQNWTPEYNCSAVNSSSCVIGSAQIETRIISNLDQNEKGEGYVQISNSPGACRNPASGNYSKYLAYGTLNGAGKQIGKFCGKNKNPDSECGINLNDNLSGNSCFGIKSYAAQKMITDTFQIKYTLCPL